MQKYDDMESGISQRSGPEDSENKQGFFSGQRSRPQ